MIRFKQFLEDAAAGLHKWEALLHHIAEEELIACRVTSIKLSSDGRAITVYAHCADRPRDEGRQDDLSEKLTRRLSLHPLPEFGRLTARVNHVADTVAGSIATP